MKRTFVASLEQLSEMIDFIKGQAQSSGADSSTLGKIELASEEALVNIVHHGYQKQQGPIEIACEDGDAGKSFRLIIQDRGIPYNPLTSVREPDPRPRLSDYTVGGYGLFLILQVMDEVDYRRDHDINQLTLVKYL